MATNWTINGVLAENLYEFGTAAQSVLQNMAIGTATALGNASTLNAGDLESIVRSTNTLAGSSPVSTAYNGLVKVYIHDVSVIDNIDVYRYLDINVGAAAKGIFATVPTPIAPTNVSQTFASPASYNGDGATSSTYSETFADRFNANGDAITLYDFSASGWSDSNTLIDIGNNQNVSTGQITNAKFTLATNAPIGTHTATYVFRCYATNGAGESVAYASWTVSVSFSVTQGAVPTTTNDYTNLGTQQVNQGSTAQNTISASFVSNFTSVDPILEYRLDSLTQVQFNNVSVTAPFNTVTAWATHEHNLLSTAPIGLHTEVTTMKVSARNKYGWSATSAIWEVTSSFNVNAVLPTVITPSTILSQTRSYLAGSGIKTFPVFSFDVSTAFSNPTGGGALTYSITAYATSTTNIAEISWQSKSLTGSILDVYMQFFTDTAALNTQFHEIFDVQITATNSFGSSVSTATFRSEVYATAVSSGGGGGTQ